MKNVLVVHRPEEWPTSDTIETVDRKTFLSDPRFRVKSPGLRVVNLSRNFGYQSVGYYVSLLADARGYRVLPTAALSQDIKNESFLGAIDDELSGAVKRCLDAQATKIVIRVEVGETDDPKTAEIGARLFRLLPIPILSATFRKIEDVHTLTKIAIHGGSDLSDSDRARVLARLEAHLEKRPRSAKAKSYRFDLAILHDPTAEDQPSNPRALRKFVEAAESASVRAELVTRDDYARLPEYDALFIRETTAVNHYTYRFARRAQAEGIVVIDDPDSILRCTNKVFLAELLRGRRVPHPDTQIITKDDFAQAAAEASYPAVLKRPDGSFSLGSYRVHSPDEYEMRAKELLETSELILAQPFMKSDYDWRIGVIDGVPLFACRYYMAKGHWQIIHREGDIQTEGDHRTVPIDDAPRHVVLAATSASRLIGNGFYGVDVKDVDGKAFVIEVNDNPNVDAGVEDQILKDGLYRRIMDVFVARMERAKARRGHE